MQFVMFFTLRESRGYRISFVACRAEALAKAGQGFAVCDYSFTLDASDMQHSRLLQQQGKTKGTGQKTICFPAPCAGRLYSLLTHLHHQKRLSPFLTPSTPQ